MKRGDFEIFFIHLMIVQPKGNIWNTLMWSFDYETNIIEKLIFDLMLLDSDHLTQSNPL